MKKQLLYTVLVLLTTHLTTAQVLFSEDFDNLTVGDLSTDPTGITPGQNNWYVNSTYNGEAMVTLEPNKGNVLAIGEKIHSGNGQGGGRALVRQENMDVLWNNRTNGNNILQLKYDFYVSGTFPETTKSRVALRFNNRIHKLVVSSDTHGGVPKSERSATTSSFLANGTDNGRVPLGNNTTYPEIHYNFPFDTWVSVELFVDYDLDKFYIYIPSMGILASDDFSASSDQVPETLIFEGVTKNHSFDRGIKYDNIKLSALPSLPSYLGVDDFISSKFNVFPNPATDWVVITNSENIGIKELSVYDITGKIVKLQKGKNENEVQLNIDNLSSGTYFLHIVTDEGTGIKKLVKK